MNLNKRKDKALESVKGAILRFRDSLTREDEDGWNFYREAEFAFNEMLARTRLACNCQQNKNVSIFYETTHCCCSANKRANCRCN